MLTRLKKQHKTHHIYTPIFPHFFFFLQRWMIYLHDFTTFFWRYFSPFIPEYKTASLLIWCRTFALLTLLHPSPLPLFTLNSYISIVLHKDPDFVAVKCASKKPHRFFFVFVRKGLINLFFFPDMFCLFFPSFFQNILINQLASHTHLELAFCEGLRDFVCTLGCTCNFWHVKRLVNCQSHSYSSLQISFFLLF